MFANSEGASRQAELRLAFQVELPIPTGTEPHLAETLTETLQRTGNFVRAQLARSAAEAFEFDHQSSLHLAIALEYFHTASLLFDDLPSMDDATHRRGAMCVHQLYGEGPAILAALALINRAYALLWKASSRAAPAEQAKALSFVEKYLGLGGLLNGQSEDLQYSRLPMAQRSPQAVAIGKTVALIRLSLVLPAILSAASPRTIHLLNRLAVVWGLSYQVLDDLKDVLHDVGRAGKTTARDSALDRPNLALTFGQDAALRQLGKLVRLGERIVTTLQRREASLNCLNEFRERLAFEVAAVAGELLGTRQCCS